jgi:hypothetical protein
MFSGFIGGFWVRVHALTLSVLRRSVEKTVALTAALLWVLGCAPQTSSVSNTCVVNPDQASLFMGHWSTHPIPLAVEANDFSASEVTAIKAAINTWNNFFKASKGFELYLSDSTNVLGTTSAGGTRVSQGTVCSTPLVGANGFTNKIMLYKTTSGWSYGSSVMALTSTCPIITAGSTYRKFIAAVMEVNFQNYFNAGQPIPDLQSIVTHELGHMLGLNHSCTGSACSKAPADYVSAMMYPSLGFDGTAGRLKRILNTNDEERANCLY